MEIIARGAEAVLYKKGGNLVKERIKKGYRLEAIDTALRKRRTRNEARLIRNARRAGINVPGIEKEDRYSLEMEFLEGKKVLEILDDSNAMKICSKIGESIGKLHSANIIHGDLTTSNMILKEGRVFFIDFGLGQNSMRIEDKATDLHLLKESLDATHFKIAANAWKIILKAYQNNCSDAERVVETLEQIKRRGRYAKR
jgi:Kae1-associated kinase Bud32